MSLDFDGDGKIDLAHCSGENGQLVIRPLRSNGTAFVLDQGAKTETGLPWSAAAPLIPLDFDGDGKGDLVYARSEDDRLQIRLLRSDGKRFVPEAADAAIGDVPYSPVLFGLDTNNDGKPDLVSARIDGGTLEVRTLLSNGIGLEPPHWLEQLEDEVQRVREQWASGERPPRRGLAPGVSLTFADLERQLDEWERPL